MKRIRKIPANTCLNTLKHCIHIIRYDNNSENIVKLYNLKI